MASELPPAIDQAYGVIDGLSAKDRPPASDITHRSLPSPCNPTGLSHQETRSASDNVLRIYGASNPNPSHHDHADYIDPRKESEKNSHTLSEDIGFGSSASYAPQSNGARSEEPDQDGLPDNLRILVTRDFDVAYFLNLSRLTSPAMIRLKLYARLGINEDQYSQWQLFRFSDSQLKHHPLNDFQVWDLCRGAYRDAILLVLVVLPVHGAQSLLSSLPARPPLPASRSTSSLSSSDRCSASLNSNSHSSPQFKPHRGSVPSHPISKFTNLSSYPLPENQSSVEFGSGGGTVQLPQQPASIAFSEAEPSLVPQVRGNRSASASHVAAASALGELHGRHPANTFSSSVTERTQNTNFTPVRQHESQLCKQRVSVPPGSSHLDGYNIKHSSLVRSPPHINPGQRGDRLQLEHSSVSSSSHHTHPLPKSPNKTTPAIALIQTAVSKIGHQFSNFKATNNLNEKRLEINHPHSPRPPHDRVQVLNTSSHNPQDSRPPLISPKAIPTEIHPRGPAEGVGRTHSALKRGDAIRWGASQIDPFPTSYEHQRRLSSAQYTSSPDSNSLVLSSPASTQHSNLPWEGTHPTPENLRRTSQKRDLHLRDELQHHDYASRERDATLENTSQDPLLAHHISSHTTSPLLPALEIQPLTWGPLTPTSHTEECTLTPQVWAKINRAASVKDEVDTSDVTTSCSGSVGYRFQDEVIEEEEDVEPSDMFQVPMKGSKGKELERAEEVIATSADDEPELGVGSDWVMRPGVSEVYERIDKLFPYHNLDEPIDLGPTSPTFSNPAINTSPLPVLRHNALNPEIEGAGPKSKSQMIGRARSIRVVAEERKLLLEKSHIMKSEGGEQVAEKSSKGDSTIRKLVEQPGKLRTGGLSRHKSTKLWGIRTEEVPPPGQREINCKEGELEHARSADGDPRCFSFKWVKGKLIGRGSFGEVYLAFNITKGDMLAVKRVKMNPQQPRKNKSACDEGQSIAVAALRSEIHLLKDLEHPNIVQYLGFEETAEFASIFLEYVPGGSIGSCLRAHGAFEPEVTKSFTTQTLEGLVYLHTANILHRDLKADNILVDLNGNCKISDFGISKQSNDAYQTNTSMSFQGTVFYMAPEVVHNPDGDKKGYSAKADIWSLGCVVLEMMCGRRPWSGEDQIRTLFRLGADRARPPIPGDVEMDTLSTHFFQVCFASNPRDRPMADKLILHKFLILDPSWKFQDSDLFRAIGKYSED